VVDAYLWSFEMKKFCGFFHHYRRELLALYCFWVIRKQKKAGDSARYFIVSGFCMYAIAGYSLFLKDNGVLCNTKTAWTLRKPDNRSLFPLTPIAMIQRD
jgi:hypothetical protein